MSSEEPGEEVLCQGAELLDGGEPSENLLGPVRGIGIGTEEIVECVAGHGLQALGRAERDHLAEIAATASDTVVDRLEEGGGDLNEIRPLDLQSELPQGPGKVVLARRKGDLGQKKECPTDRRVIRIGCETGLRGVGRSRCDSRDIRPARNQLDHRIPLPGSRQLADALVSHPPPHLIPAGEKCRRLCSQHSWLRA